jgi:F-type H+-transporting ATPase subunit a
MAAEQTQNVGAEINEYISHHVLMNNTEWHIPFLPAVHLPAWLPMHGFMVVLAGVLLLLAFTLGYKRGAPVQKGLGNALEVFVLFIRDNIAIPNIGEHDGKKMTPLLCTFFFFILTLNLLGQIPLFACATGNVNVTMALAGITLSFMIVGTIIKNGPVGFIKAFIPHGVPWPVLILLVPIEFAGMFIKAAALMIRLFANMMAGHIVVLALLSLCIAIKMWVAVLAVPLGIGIGLLEVFVCFLQAYIFTLLSAMFIGQMYHPAH